MRLDNITLEKNESLHVKKRVAYTDDEQGHLLKLFLKRNGDWIEVDKKTLLNKLADALKDNVDIKEFLVDFLETKLRPEVLFALEDKLEGAKIEAKEGCYHLRVTPKKGKPMTVYLIPP